MQKSQKITYLSVRQKFLPELGPPCPQMFRPTSKLSNETRFVFLSRLDQKLRCKTETFPIWWMIAVQYLIALGELSSLKLEKNQKKWNLMNLNTTE